MMQACRTYLDERLAGLTLAGGLVKPFYPATPEVPATNIYYDELPLDFLKDNDYAACCLPLQDRNKPYGKLIAKTRTLAPQPLYTLNRRRFTREIIFRCLLYAKTADDLWGTTGYIGLVEQFSQAVADNKFIADSDNSAIRIEPQDAARPWDSGVELERKLRRPRLAIVRVLFKGGIQTAKIQSIIPDFTLVPKVS